MSKDILGQAEKKEVGFHMMKAIFLLLVVVLISCARTASSVEKGPARAETEAQPDAAADAALGVFPEGEEPEAEKQAEDLTGHRKTKETLGVLEQQKRDDELERLHRAVTDPNK